MIITLTMNPAIDKTVEVDAFKVDHVNRIKDIHLDAAGKGINVSKVIKKLGGHTKTIAFLGGQNGQFIADELTKDHISFINIPVQGETRINTKIVDKLNHTFTDLNEPGPLVNDSAFKQFKDQLIKYSTSQSIVVLTGSVPKGIQSDVYQELIHRLSEFGVKTILDASGELFENGLKAKPMLVKPNIHELEMYLGHRLSNQDEIIKAGKTLIDQGVKIVVISLGEEGALFITEDKTYHAKGLKIDVQSTVGAGDAMVAGLCYGIQKNIPLLETFKLSIACSAAQVSIKGTQPPDLDLIYRLIKEVEMNEIGE